MGASVEISVVVLHYVLTVIFYNTFKMFANLLQGFRTFEKLLAYQVLAASDLISEMMNRSSERENDPMN